MPVKLNSTGGGSVTLDTPSTASNYTVTLPAATSTLIDTTSTQTLTNKTLTAAGSNTVEATSGPTSTQLAGMRNKIINGAMMIDQRNAGAAQNPIVSGNFVVDRFKYEGNQVGKLSAQQNAGSVTPPTGFTKYAGMTSLSSYTVLAGDYFLFEQFIEGFNVVDLGWGTANAQTVTLSFWVRSSLTGTFGGVISNASGNRIYGFTYSISSANTWTTATITIPGDTSGTWATDNTAGIQIRWGLGVGSSNSISAGSWGTAGLGVTGATSVVGTNGATWYVTGVQLEKGATATPFENRLYGTELALCMRYYEKSYDLATTPGTVTDTGVVVTTSNTESGGNVIYWLHYQVAKRTAPTMTAYLSSTGATGSWSYARNGASGTATATLDQTTVFSNRIYLSAGTAWVPALVYGHWTASAEL